jgi:hypothetical protein
MRYLEVNGSDLGMVKMSSLLVRVGIDLKRDRCMGSEGKMITMRKLMKAVKKKSRRLSLSKKEGKDDPQSNSCCCCSCSSFV